MDKVSLRQRFLGLRQEFCLSKEYETNSKSIMNKLRVFLNDYQSGKKLIGYYYPIRGEVQILDLWDKESEVAFPRIDFKKGSMDFVKVNSLNSLVITKSGFRQPSINAKICIPEVILIPGICFSADKYRLGFGYGHFDKYLAQIRKSGYTPITIGLCFDFQLINTFTVESHDQKVDYILTEKQII